MYVPKKKNIVCLVALFLVLCNYKVTGGRTLSDDEGRDLERQLKILNKTPIKTFQTRGGIFDCIDIHKQPALDHPLLKNHKVQMNPTFHSMSNPTSSREKLSMGNIQGITCPQGTVPIRRTHKQDLIRAKSFKNTHHAHLLADTEGGQLKRQTAQLRLIAKNPAYTGAHAKISVENLHVKQNQLSTAQIWIENGPPGEYASLRAGWIVSPDLMGNTETYLFTHWTADNDKLTGCFNLLCPGFVQVNQSIPVGYLLNDTSIYGGEQRMIELSISQDTQTKDWWLLFNGAPLGYWRGELVPQLYGGASAIVWGGLAAGPINDSPPMGNGHLPQDSYRKSCFMADLSVQTKDAANQNVIPDIDTLIPYEGYNKDDKCYGLIFAEYTKYWGLSFLFGGPGGHCP